MDKAKGVLKGGWHPSGDKEIHRKTWKTDLKGIATGRKDDSVSNAHSHASAPLSSLKDPDSFGPPPKHSAYYPNAQSPSALTHPVSASSPVARSSPALPSRKVDVEPEAVKPQGPYRVDTTGLRTDNLPKPPLRRDTNSPASAASSRPVPNLPQRKTTGPPPVLPPRQTENPHEYTPDAPPSYGEATTQAPATNGAAIDRLGRAGVNVPGFGISNNSQHGQQAQAAQGHSGQLSELQQRFARINSGSSSAVNAQPQAAAPSWKKSSSSTNGIAQSFVSGEAPFSSSSTAGKKKPPPPPVKRDTLTGQNNQNQGAPPPIPMSSKPRPG